MWLLRGGYVITTNDLIPQADLQPLISWQAHINPLCAEYCPRNGIVLFCDTAVLLMVTSKQWHIQRLIVNRMMIITPHMGARATAQIAKTLGSTSIRHRSDTNVSDPFLLNVDVMVFAIWVILVTEQGEFPCVLMPWILACAMWIIAYPVHKGLTLSWWTPGAPEVPFGSMGSE